MYFTSECEIDEGVYNDKLCHTMKFVINEHGNTVPFCLLVICVSISSTAALL